MGAEDPPTTPSGQGVGHGAFELDLFSADCFDLR